MSVRILHLRASNFVGGPERQIFAYAAAMPKDEITTWIGTFTSGSEGRGFADAGRAQGIPVWECQAAGVHAAVEALKDFIRKEQIAMVCTHGYKATILALLACRPKRIPVVPFLRGWTGENFKVRVYEAIERAALRLCPRVVALSETHAAELKKEHGWARESVRVVANAATEVPGAISRHKARTALEQRFGIKPDHLCLVSAGRLSPEKDPFTFLRAAEKIAASEPRAQFIVFGDGVLRDKLKESAASLGLAARVRFAGLVPDFRDLLPGCDVLINASRREQMPNVVLEAMVAGVPIVATSVGGVPELLAEGAGILVNPGDDAMIASATLTLLRDDTHRTHLAAKATQRLLSHFSSGAQAHQLRALYAELLPFVRFDRPALSTYPKISVVMPVRNEEHHIGAVLERLLEQDYPSDKFEIIVADGHSTDRTREVAADYAKRTPVSVRIVENPRRLSSAGRNAGVRASSGEIVVFVDGHCFIPGRHLLYDTARVMQERAVDALARPQPLRTPWNNDFQDAVASVRESALGHGRDSTIYSMTYSGRVDPTSAGATYKRTLFAELGYYDEQFDACEDVEFNHRVKAADKECYIDPTLAIFYVPRTSIRRLFTQMARYGKGRARLAHKHPQARSVTQYVPALLTVYALMLVLALPFASTKLMWVSVPFVIYLFAVLAASLSLGMRRGLSSLASPILFMCVHFGLGFGFLSELFSPATSTNRVGHSMNPNRQEATLNDRK
jgi:glycosyltransferase involved in cell wall biosynthesis